MSLTIAIHSDDYTSEGRAPFDDSFSHYWEEEIKAQGHKVKCVDVFSDNILDELKGCDGLMWRWAHFGGMFRQAQALLPVLEKYLDIPVFPDWNTCWHYDDKVAQAHLFAALDIPQPPTKVVFLKSAALALAGTVQYPLVIKTANGAGSTNVRLIKDKSEFVCIVENMFDNGCFSMREFDAGVRAWLRMFVKTNLSTLLRRKYFYPVGYDKFQKGYLLVQEFLPGNDFDTRITVIGDKAFGYRRMNRPGDFRASGSGLPDYDHTKIDTGFVRLALESARKLGSQSLAFDGLYDKAGNHVIGEISYTYVAHMVHSCQGYWQLKPDGTLEWTEGNFWPGHVQARDFIKHVESITK